ncbi:endonuclease [Flavobacterium magnum]|uniref:Endonuclease n=1 Tax=Flavobacterium magnum TaxID=2162713 RepID=A0A2S0REK9_9FLAO|nr:endonuclease/exonuclease/phosphatase family protein [Flavobacterium magnum]AWA29959.1 endonuclease [Flavobacterium magnum]
MKNLSLFNKIMFVCNIILACCTFMAYLLPFMAPKLFPFLSVFTLGLPLMLVLNLLFFAYWAVQFKRQVLLSGIVLLIGITFINKFYKFSAPDYVPAAGDFSVMSYNVRLFNKFEWSDKETVPVEISDFVKEKNPSLLCIQEFSNAADFDYSGFPHRFIFSNGKKIKTGQAIFSRFKIINTGHIEFPDSNNNAIFADVIKGKDTIRVYNMHLQSIKISPDVHDISEDINEINQKKSEMMFRRIGKAFRKQQLQAEIIMNHKQNCKYPIIICGDMNNSAFSYVYRNIKGDLNDCFVEAGKGFGKTYDFNYYPARIDYIFADERFDVRMFNSYPEIVDSDHFPVMAVLSEKKTN